MFVEGLGELFLENLVLEGDGATGFDLSAHGASQFVDAVLMGLGLGRVLGLGELSEGAQFSGGVGRLGVGGVVHVHEVAHDLDDGPAGDVPVVGGNDGIAGSGLVDGVDAVQLAGPEAGDAVCRGELQSVSSVLIIGWVGGHQAFCRPLPEMKSVFRQVVHFKERALLWL